MTGRGAAMLVAALCVSEVLAMAGTLTAAALLPTLITEWRLDASVAGLLSGAVQGGYVLAVPFLVASTDRVDPKRIYLCSCLALIVGPLGFALFATGPISGALFQALTGIGLAGTYMPGLRILSDGVSGSGQARAVSFYTACYALGSGLSILMAGLVADVFGWRAAFLAAAFGAGLSLVIVGLAVPAAPRASAANRQGRLFDFRPVLRHRPAMGYVLAYAAHCWELFGMRSWIVAFLAFAAARGGASVAETTIAALVTGIFVAGLPASILGNEVAMRIGRRRLIRIAMLVSAAIGIALGLSSAAPFWLVVVLAFVFGITTMADSASLTVGTVGNAEPGRRGATMAVHSVFGSGAAALAPIAFGFVIDVGGGTEDATAWALAFGMLAVTVAFGSAALALTGDRAPEIVKRRAGANGAETRRRPLIGHEREPTSHMTKNGRSQAKRWGIIAAGWLFLILGIAGLVLPFLQGILFILVGISLLSYEYHWARVLISRVRQRFPWLARHLDEAQDWIRRKGRSARARLRLMRRR